MFKKLFFVIALAISLTSSAAFGQASGQPKKNEPTLAELKFKAESALRALQDKDKKLVGYLADLKNNLAVAKKQDKMSDTEKEQLNGSMSIVTLSSYETLKSEMDFRLSFQEALNAFHGNGKVLEAFAEWAATLNLRIPPSRDKEVTLLTKEAQGLLGR